MVDDKIETDDSLEEVIVKLSEGNPGAATALSTVLELKGPQDFLPFALRLDMQRIYGPDIWIKFKDENNDAPEEFYNDIMN